jgi:hypothetical protein
MKVAMQSQIGPRSPLALRKPVAVVMGLGVHLVLAWPACAGLASGAYQTLPGATVEERGDRVPNGSRVVPISATLTFDLSASPPSLSAVMPNAVLEGGDPFALTVRSSSGSQLVDGSHSFMGDYLGDIYASGTQYLFDWRFSTASDGTVVWNGSIYWAGGHIWQVAVSNITLLPVAWLNISRVGTVSVQITWATNFADHVLEYATSLPAVSWSTVPNLATNAGDRLSVTLDTGISNRFYRLRKP